MSRRLRLVYPGRLQAGLSLGLAGAVATVIATSSSTVTAVSGRLAIVGLALFAIAVGLGSARLVGLATLPVLGAALVVSAAAAEPAWVRSIVLGIVWYMAVELAWEAVERRDGVRRSSAFNDRRVEEVTTVVILAFVVTTTGFLLSFLAPVRNVLIVGSVIICLIAGLRLATRRLQASSR